MKGFPNYNNIILRLKHLKKLPHKTVQDILLLLVPILLILNIGMLYTENVKLRMNIEKIHLKELPIENYIFAQYPTIHKSLNFTLNSAAQQDSLLSANSAIVIDDDSQVVLYSKNPTVLFPMASTTKIMTALVAMEHYGLQDILTIYDSSVSGAVVGFKKGEQVYFKDILYAMLLPSGNDAAVAIAQNYPGGEKMFIEKMNQKAQQLHLTNTVYMDSTGLSEKNTTTAFDLARLSSYAMKNSLFAQIVGSKNHIITDLSKKNVYSLTNLNRLLGIEGVNGIKTGFTEEAGEVLATSRVVNGHNIISIVMKSKNRFLDTQSLLSFISKNLEYIDVELLLSEKNLY